jgi:hypothetical protein
MVKNGILGVLAVGLALSMGCKQYDGPRAARSKPKPDLPEYSIEEQQRRAYDKYPALPQDDRRAGPAMEIDRPSPIGR